MQIVEKRLAELKPYDNNPRINDRAVGYVAESIKRFGFKVPVVIDKNDVIVCGHTRYEACKELGIDSVPCVIADDLSDDEIKEYRLADNKVAEIAEWDIDKLNAELGALPEFDFDALGFVDTQHDEDFFGEVNPIDNIEPAEEKQSNYKIVYEIAFNNESEQEDWHEFVKQLRKEYEDFGTISQRILVAVNEWRAQHGYS